MELAGLEPATSWVRCIAGAKTWAMRAAKRLCLQAICIARSPAVALSRGYI